VILSNEVMLNILANTHFNTVMLAKLTRSQEKVWHFLQGQNSPMSAQELHTALKAQQRIGLATVYRALETLKLKGLICALPMPNGETLYSPLPTDRHHLNCLGCHKVIALDNCPLEVLPQAISQSYNFKVFYHTLEFFGLCRECQLAGEV
jgi:Fur family ferric uptake transcriptional regulator